MYGGYAVSSLSSITSSSSKEHHQARGTSKQPDNTHHDRPAHRRPASRTRSLDRGGSGTGHARGGRDDVAVGVDERADAGVAEGLVPEEPGFTGVEGFFLLEPGGVGAVRVAVVRGDCCDLYE